MLVLGLALLTGTMAAPAGAITGGRPDNTAHPYVGIVIAPDGAFCSGVLLAPRVLLTAGHCTWTPVPAERPQRAPRQRLRR
jgi:hypothetical protein